MNSHLQRAIMLIGQSRFEMAEKELQQAFGVTPNDPLVHAYYAICNSELEKFKEARECAANAIKLDPNQPFSYYAAAWVARSTNEAKKGLGFIHKALELDPYDVDFFAEKSALHFELKQWQDSLDSADSGLQLDPEDIACLNLRAAALVKLGKKMDAGTSIQSALERQPDSPITHANFGWTLLEKNQPKKAMEHFREALRLEPNMEWARVGIIEAMKGQYFIYRIMLNWFLWCSKLSGQKMWMIVLGGYFGYRFLVSIATNNPAARPYVIPLIALYLGFVIMTWISVPLFNLILRTNKFGRMALSDEEKRTSTWVGICLFFALASVLGYFVVGGESYLMAALGSALMIPAVAYYYTSDEGWPRATHGLLLLVMAFLAVVSLISLVAHGFAPLPWSKLGLATFGLSYLPLILLGVASQFGVQFLAVAKPKKGSNAGFWVWIVGGTLTLLAAIMFIGAICLMAFALAFEDQVSSRFIPIRLVTSQVESVEWQNKDAIKSITKEFKELDFKLVGDFRIDDFDQIKIRYLKNTDGSFAAEILEETTMGNVYFGLTGIRKADNTPVSVSNAPNIDLYPDSWTKVRLDETPAKMLQWLEERTEGMELVLMSNAQILETVSRLHAEEMDFLLARGGYTTDEFIELVSQGGNELPRKQAELVLDVWRKNYRDQIDQFVLNRMSSDPAYKDFDIARMLPVHLYTAAADIALWIGDKDAARNLQDKVDQRWPKLDVLSLIDKNGTVEGLTKIKHFDRPIPVDVYYQEK